MKAAVLFEPNTPLQIVECELDPPKANEVRVRMRASGVCQSDWHVMNGDWLSPMPIVPGHEAAGEVIECGPGVTTVTSVDLIVDGNLPGRTVQLDAPVAAPIAAPAAAICLVLCDYDMPQLGAMQAMKADTGHNPAIIRADGGLVANKFVCQFIAEPRHMNGGGFMHGGCLLTFADYSCFAIAEEFMTDGVSTVSVNLSGDFLSAVPVGAHASGCC